MESLLDFDQSELESHLFSHLSEIGRREDYGSDLSEEDDVDIDDYQRRMRSSGAQQSTANTWRRQNKSNSVPASVQKSATKTGRVLGELGSRGRSRKQHEVRKFSINQLRNSFAA